MSEPHQVSCTRSIGIDAGHRVYGHESKCAHLHGHRYEIQLTASARLDSLGRVIDFGVLKEIVGGWLLDKWDHGMILGQNDPLVATIDAIGVDGTGRRQKLYVLPCNPTAENMASFLLDTANELLAKAGHEHVVVTKVRVWETPNCFADATL